LTNDAARHLAVGLVIVAIGHYVFSPYFHGAAPDAPPVASLLTVASTSSVTFNGIRTVDAITDAEYLAPAVDTRHPVTVVPALPPTVTALSVGGIYPGIVTFKSST